MSETSIKDIDLLIFGEGAGSEPRLIVLNDRTTVLGVVESIRSQGLFDFAIEEVSVFIEDGDRELEFDAVLCEIGIGNQHRLHVHRCQHVEVSITSAAGNLSHRFRPAATVRSVREWALKELGAPAASFTLRASAGDPLVEDVHIGTLTRDDTCSLALVLVEDGRLGYIVKVYNEDSGRHKFLYATPQTPLSTLISEIYLRFAVDRRQDDRLRCECSGEDVFALAHMTVSDYVHSGHCHELVWLFAGGTGGA